MRAAEKRMHKFARYIKRFKKVPKPPQHLPPLNNSYGGIDDMLEVKASWDWVACDVSDCTDAEKRFLLKAVRKLGFKPEC